MKTNIKYPIAFLALCLFVCILSACGETPEPTDATEATRAAKEEPTEATKASEPQLTGDLLKIQFYSEDVDDWGDCTYIELPNGENMLIDTGMPAAASKIVEDLMDRGIDHVNHVIITHSHADHARGLSNVLANIRVDDLYCSGYWTTDFQWVERDVKSLGVKCNHIKQGDAFDIGEVHFDVLWPSAEYIKEQPGVPASGTDGPGGTVNINGSSLLIKMTYKNNKVMFCGDIYKAPQETVIDTYKDNPEMLDVDVLKIPHHGYDNAVNANFVKALSPDYAFSMGTHTMNSKSYGIYSNEGTCKVYLSWMNGNAFVVMNGTDIRVSVDDETINDYYKSAVPKNESSDSTDAGSVEPTYVEPDGSDW